MFTTGRSSLRERVLRAGGWSLAGHVSAQAVRLGSNLVMTRLLVPEMFGVMAIATMVAVVLNMLSDIGLRQFIIQSKRGDDPAFLDTAWVFQVARGFGLWLGALLLSAALLLASRAGLLPPGSTYAAEVLPWVIAGNSFAAVILGFQSTKVATAYRRFDQKRIVQIELVAQLVGVTVMILVAATTRTIWALVIGGLVAALMTTLLGHAWLAGHRNRFRWSSEAARDLTGFGKWAFVSSVFTVLAGNGDRLMLAAFVEADVLGVYAIAMLVLGAVEGALGKVFYAISLPALSEVARSEPARLREIYYRLRVPGDVVLLFMGGLLFAVGRIVIEVLYDPRYAAAGGMLEVLALSLIAARYGVSYQIYLAVGVPRYMAIIQVVRCVALFTLVPLLYFLAGLPGALWAIALHGLAMTPFVHAFNERLGLNDARKELLVLAALPLGYACGFAAARIFEVARSAV
jgi:O-antigen/teichoic acid export membrane protein